MAEISIAGLGVTESPGSRIWMLKQLTKNAYELRAEMDHQTLK